MRKTKAAVVVGVVLALTSCGYIIPPAHHVTVESPAYDPAVSARVRFLSGNGTKKTIYYPAQACYRPWWKSDPNKVVLDEGIWGPMRYSSRSVTIGMPESPRTWMRVEGLTLMDSIREVVVPANQPLTVSTSERIAMGTHASVSCSPPPLVFVPQPGQDYEVFIDYNGGRCRTSVRRINGRDLDESVEVKQAPECSDEAVKSSGENATKPPP